MQIGLPRRVTHFNGVCLPVKYAGGVRTVVGKRKAVFRISCSGAGGLSRVTTYAARRPPIALRHRTDQLTMRNSTSDKCLVGRTALPGYGSA